ATTVSATLAPANFVAGTGTSASNYAFPTLATGAGTITPKSVTGSIIGTPQKVYNGTTAAALTSANYSLTGVVAGESLTVTKIIGAYNTKNVTATTVTATLAAGDFTAGAGTTASDYALPASVSGPGVITPLAITVPAKTNR